MNLFLLSPRSSPLFFSPTCPPPLLLHKIWLQFSFHVSLTDLDHSIWHQTHTHKCYLTGWHNNEKRLVSVRLCFVMGSGSLHQRKYCQAKKMFKTVCNQRWTEWLQNVGCTGTSLVVQWLRSHPSTAGGTGLIPGQGTKIPHCHILWLKKKKKSKRWSKL